MKAYIEILGGYIGPPGSRVERVSHMVSETGVGITVPGNILVMVDDDKLALGGHFIEAAMCLDDAHAKKHAEDLQAIHKPTQADREAFEKELKELLR